MQKILVGRCVLSGLRHTNPTSPQFADANSFVGSGGAGFGRPHDGDGDGLDIERAETGQREVTSS